MSSSTATALSTIGATAAPRSGAMACTSLSMTSAVADRGSSVMPSARLWRRLEPARWASASTASPLPSARASTEGKRGDAAGRQDRG